MNASTDRGVICFCGTDWWYHNRAHSDIQLMLRIAARERVLLVNSIGMRMPMPGRSSKVFSKILRKLKSMAKFLRRPSADHPQLYVMTPIAVPVFGIPGLRQMAAWFVRAQVSLVARCLGIRNPLIVVTPPTAWNVVRPMRRRGLIYNRSDKHSAFIEADQDLIRSLERQLMHHADHVLYVSRELMADEQALCADNAFFLDHGVDASWLATPLDREPGEMRVIPRPRIGFFGGLRSHLVDFELLGRLADELPDCHLVLIGDAPSDIGELVARPNVHWLGFRDHRTIPTLGAGFDVALMPYLDNDWIRHCNPIKLKEYLALGLPVVSTDFPEAREYAPHVETVADHEAFIAAVRRLASAPRDETLRELRRRSVGDCTWEDRAKTLLELTGSPSELVDKDGGPGDDRRRRMSA